MLLLKKITYSWIFFLFFFVYSNLKQSTINCHVFSYYHHTHHIHHLIEMTLCKIVQIGAHLDVSFAEKKSGW